MTDIYPYLLVKGYICAAVGFAVVMAYEASKKLQAIDALGSFFRIVITAAAVLLATLGGLFIGTSYEADESLGNPILFRFLKNEVVYEVSGSVPGGSEPEKNITVIKMVGKDDLRFLVGLPVVFGKGTRFTKKGNEVYVLTEPVESSKQNKAGD